MRDPRDIAGAFELLTVAEWALKRVQERFVADLTNDEKEILGGARQRLLDLDAIMRRESRT